MEDIGAEAVAFWIVLTALVGCAAVLARAGWERWRPKPSYKQAWDGVLLHCRWNDAEQHYRLNEKLAEMGRAKIPVWNPGNIFTEVDAWTAWDQIEFHWPERGVS
jgi:hypothetical protein